MCTCICARKSPANLLVLGRLAHAHCLPRHSVCMEDSRFGCCHFPHLDKGRRVVQVIRQMGLTASHIRFQDWHQHAVFGVPVTLLFHPCVVPVGLFSACGLWRILTHLVICLML